MQHTTINQIGYRIPELERRVQTHPGMRPQPTRIQLLPHTVPNPTVPGPQKTCRIRTVRVNKIIPQRKNVHYNNLPNDGRRVYGSSPRQLKY